MASLFTAKGQKAVESAAAKKLDLKKVMIRLKDGESVRVRLLGITDDTVREYMAQGEFALNIYTQPDISPLIGKPSPLTVAANSGIEKFKNLYPRKRYLIVFADIDTGQLRVWDASKTQGKAMQDLMKEYDASKDQFAFTLKRKGDDKSTVYNLIPIMSLSEDDKKKFEEAGKLKVESDFLDNALSPRTEEQQIELLKAAGFPVADFFEDVVEETDTQTGESEVDDIEEVNTDDF